ncbi:signal peptide peptidase-domain-containing protein [Emericellopsis atlantica]|uniref:Signal peptide peptidase-domain-containing protein n=1 Tax=Emericellopsis atlantica TaxID=2614577 RepID=A0A9P7ZM46_9HYPO|nr:signal peptide peptidase-domain-containing protein [Emericellopsis atlantica]KAG9254227.1 signal peptide peptidase-domain-containing protein [Emericellopsis atlantica]
MDNTTASGALNGTLDAHNATIPASPETVWSLLQDFSFLALEAQLVLGALGIIYVGAHASLHRPPSAAAPARQKGTKKNDDHGDERDDERITQGLELSDAIMFPVMAGIMLVGLYYLIQYLQDPEILNKVLRWYISTMSIVSLFSLYAHGMGLVVGFIFPRYWRGRDGVLRKANQATRQVSLCDDVGNVSQPGKDGDSPLPGLLSCLPLGKRAGKAAWDARELVMRQWLFKFYVHGMGDEKAKIKLTHMIAFFASIATALIYSSTSSSFLSNVLGYGLCYGSFLVLSPTDLLIGSLVLSGLFVYDIVMVFYTPYMVTVATTLDVPIKLTFKAASRQSILGLGDIVLPGLVMAWALRLDLWLHYQRKVKYEPTELQIREKDASGMVVIRKETKHKEIKAPYVTAQGAWGERFWTGVFGRKPMPAEISASKFPKTYFYATVVGYALGMAATLSMLLVFKRGQPALLYLVPGVLGSLYVTAFARGEMKLIWGYTEDGSIDTKDVVVEVDADGRATKRIGEMKDGVVDTTKDDKKKKDEKEQEAKKKDDEAKKIKDDKTKESHKVFNISLETMPVAPV